MDLDTDINTEFTIPGGYYFKTYERPDKSYIKKPLELSDLLDTAKIVQKFLTKQTHIDKLLDVIQRKSTERHTFAYYN